MSDLQFHQRTLFELILGVQEGCVLGLDDRSFNDPFLDAGIDIESDRYSESTSSKTHGK